MARNETQVLRECCEYLRREGFLFWRNMSHPVFGRTMPKGYMRGLSDICAIRNGRFVAIEVKREGSDTERERNGRTVREGKLTPEQADFAASVTMNGGLFILVRSVAELEDFVYRTFKTGAL